MCAIKEIGKQTMKKMKRNAIHILVLIAVMSLISCKKFLDKQPNDMLNIDQVFSLRAETDRYLANVYSYIPDPLVSNGVNYTPISDEADWVFNWSLNEYDPGNADIAKYINLIRERAGLPALPVGLNQEQMRQKIRHERRIELAFEEHRLWDVKRWKIAEQTDSAPIYGMNVTAGTSFTDLNFYKRTQSETRAFQKKHMLWPIPQSEIDRNNKLVQNPKW